MCHFTNCGQLPTKTLTAKVRKLGLIKILSHLMTLLLLTQDSSNKSNLLRYTMAKEFAKIHKCINTCFVLLSKQNVKLQN